MLLPCEKNSFHRSDAVEYARAVKPLDFQAPTSVEETLRLLERHGQGATLLAGGQSLMILLRQGLVAPEMLVGLKRPASRPPRGNVRSPPVLVPPGRVPRGRASLPPALARWRLRRRAGR